MIAKGLGGKIAVIDTERGSASLYSDLVDFDTLELNPPFTPERCIDALLSAANAGYEICIFDSITHEWDGAGGCLESNEEIAQAKFRGNTWAAWNVTTPRHRAFMDGILQAPMHVIATMRSKTETVQGDDKKVKKLGMKAVQREGSDYEFTVVLDLEHDKHYAIGSKDRTRLFSEPHVISPATGVRLREWLESGAAVAEEPKPAQKPISGPDLSIVSGGKHKGKPWADIGQDYLEWCANSGKAPLDLVNGAKEELALRRNLSPEAFGAAQ